MQFSTLDSIVCSLSRSLLFRFFLLLWLFCVRGGEREREKAVLRRRCCKKPSSSTVLSSFSHGVISVVAGVAIITSCCFFFFCFFFNKCSAKRCSDSAIHESDIGIVRRNCRSRMFATDRRDQDAAAIGSQQALQGNLELRHDDRAAGRSARIVEGIDPVRNALDAQVHSAHGLQRRPSIRAHRSSNRQDQRCRPLDSRFRCRRARSSRHRHSFRGFAGPFCTGPFDVVKTRLMAQSSTDIRYKGLVHALSRIYTEEGLFALWKGLVPRLMRIPPGQAIMWTVADQVTGLYERKFIKPTKVNALA